MRATGDILREELLGRIANDAQVAILILSKNANIVMASRFFAEIVGFKVEDMVGKSFTLFLADDDSTECGGNISMYFKKDDARIICRDSKVRYMAWRISELESGNFLAIGIETTETVLVKRQFQSLVDNSLQGIILFKDGRITYSNAAADGILGFSDLVGMSVYDLMRTVDFTDDDERRILSDIADGTASGNYVISNRHIKLHVVELEDCVHQVVFIDVTAEILLEQTKSAVIERWEEVVALLREYHARPKPLD